MAISSALLWVASVLVQVQTGPGSDEKHLSKPKFRIPVSLQADKVAGLQAVLLYVSSNRGKSWELHGRIKPGEDGFQYLAKSDGVYWFTVAVLDKQGNQDPRDIYQGEDRLKIVVDTLQPEVKLSAEKQGSSIQVRWSIREEYPDLASMKLEAKIPGGDTWLPVQIKPALAGSGALQVPQDGPIELRLSVHDRAGNRGMGEAQIGLEGQGNPTPGSAAPTAPGGLASKPAGEGLPPVGSLVPVAGPTALSPGMPTGNPPAPTTVAGIPTVPTGTPPLPQEIPAPAPVPTSPLPSGGPMLPPAAPMLPANNAGALPVSPPLPASGNYPSPSPNYGVAVHGGPVESTVAPHSVPMADQQVLASSSAYPAANVPFGQGVSRMGAGKPVQVVNRRQVRLEYEVVKTGSSGIGTVEVYVTLDDGLNWSLAATEPVMIPPTEAAGVGPQRLGVMLPLTQEGVVHGFTLVVKSKAGLGRPAPQRGEAPQIRVELDSTHPDASLLNVLADPNRREALVINYKATDRNLANMPVQLEWSERRDGPWNPVSEGEIANSGKFLWLVPTQVPPSVFMRLTVKDKAGNVAIAQTPEPILVDLHVPEFNVLGIQPR